MDTIKELLDVDDMMRILKKGKRQTYEICRQELKAFGAFKIGHEWRITQAGMQQYIDSKIETQQRAGEAANG